VLHDLHLDAISDVADRFPRRARADGRHHVVDFELAELAELSVTERRDANGQAAFPGRFRPGQAAFRIATLEQEIELVSELNRLTGRDVGVYAEIKHPEVHAAHGIDLGARVLETLAEHGYTDESHTAFVQCFDAAELRRLRERLGTRLKLVQLVEAGCGPDGPPGGWTGVAAYADAVGCAYTDLLEIDGWRLTATALADALGDAGLAIHTYTLRRDALGAFRGSFETLLRFLFEAVGVDGVFTDHPDVALRVRDALA
jgi:glycerophosphoryl diester phosphodiesterase